MVEYRTSMTHLAAVNHSFSQASFVLSVNKKDFEKIPEELWQKIIYYLGFDDLFRVSMSSRVFSRIVFLKKNSMQECLAGRVPEKLVDLTGKSFTLFVQKNKSFLRTSAPHQLVLAESFFYPARSSLNVLAFRNLLGIYASTSRMDSVEELFSILELFHEMAKKEAVFLSPVKSSFREAIKSYQLQDRKEKFDTVRRFIFGACLSCMTLEPFSFEDQKLALDLQKKIDEEVFSLVFPFLYFCYRKEYQLFSSLVSKMPEEIQGRVAFLGTQEKRALLLQLIKFCIELSNTFYFPLFSFFVLFCCFLDDFLHQDLDASLAVQKFRPQLERFPSFSEIKGAGLSID